MSDVIGACANPECACPLVRQKAGAVTPGARRIASGGLCHACYMRAHRAKQAALRPPKPKREPKPIEYDERERYEPTTTYIPKAEPPTDDQKAAVRKLIAARFPEGAGDVLEMLGVAS